MWRSHNRLDGKRRHYMNSNCMPLFFMTRRECRAYIQDAYGYIKKRDDLRAEPYGWRLPKAVRVEIILREIA